MNEPTLSAQQYLVVNHYPLDKLLTKSSDL